MHDKDKEEVINEKETAGAAENMTEQEENTDDKASVDTEASTEEKATEEVDQLEKVTAELADSKDKYLRLYAEFENYRRRTNKEKSDLIKTAAESVLKEFLSILDDFERAQKTMEKDGEEAKQKKKEENQEVKAVKEGVALIHNKIVKILEQQGVKAMESSIGKPFNVEEQESITQIPAPSEDMKGKVIDEIEKGYYLHEKVLRFAKVVIGS